MRWWRVFPWRQREAEAKKAFNWSLSERREVNQIVRELHRYEVQNNFALSLNKALGRGT